VRGGNIYSYSILLMMFAVPTAFYSLIWLGFIVSFIFWITRKEYLILSRRILRPEFLFPLFAYIYVLVGFFVASDKGAALSSLSKMLPIILFPMILGTSSVVNRKLFNKGSLFFIASTFLSVVYAILYALYDVYISGVWTHWEDEAVYNKFFSYGLTRVFRNWHPTYVAMFVNISMAMIIIQIKENAKFFKTVNKFFICLLFSVLILSLYLLDSMIGFVGFFILILYFTLYYVFSKNSSITVKTVSIFVPILVGFIIYDYNPLKIDKIDTLKKTEWIPTDKQEKRNVLTIRMAKWETHLYIFRQHLLWGTTLADIKNIREKKYIEMGYLDLAKNNYNAHNQYIEILTSFGVIGSIFFFGIILLPFVKFQNVHSLVIPISIMFLLTFFTESVLNRQQGLLAFMLFFSLFISRTNEFLLTFDD